jgi:Carboxypeptidase regulatory-like domain
MRSLRTSCGVVLAFLAIVATGSVLFAQTGQNFGELVGKVIDEEGAVLPGVMVTLSGPAMMGTQTAVTNDRGAYRFPAVTSGTYQLTFELPGFAKLGRENIIVPVRQTVTVDAQMKVAALQETVTVTGASPVVDVANAKVGARLDQSLLQNVPTSRSIFGSATLLPGMVMARQDPAGINASTSTNMVAHGSNNYNLNYFGVTADTPQDYGKMYYMDFNAAEEISVDTAAMGAEIGGGGGANINIIPKSGGNAPKGSVYYSGTGKGLAADNVDDDLRAQGITAGTRLLRLNDINTDAGGPFVKDRLWWFGSFRNYTTFEQVIGFPKDFESNLRNYTSRINYLITPRNQLSGFWTYNRKLQPNRNGDATQPNPVTTWRQESPKNLFNGNYTSTIGQNTFVEVSSSYFHMHWPTTYSDEFFALPEGACLAFECAASIKSPALQDVTGGVFAGADPQGEHIRDAYRYQTNVGLTRYVDGVLGASHQIKTGFENWYGWGGEVFDVFGDTRFRFRNGLPSEIAVYNTPLEQTTHMRNFAAFAQDRISFARVTFNLGLRWSFYDGYLPEQTGGGGRWFPVTTYPRLDAGYNWNTFAPRTSVVYQLTKDGLNVAKASYSRYYEVMYTTEFADVINPNLIRSGKTTAFGVATYRWLGDVNGNGILDDNEYDHNPLNTFTPRSNNIDPNLRNPKTDEITLGYERELTSLVAFSALWVQRWFKDQTVDSNAGIPTSAYVPHEFPDPGPDNIVSTADDSQVTFYDVTAPYLGKDAFLHTNYPGTQHYKGLELALTKRMANRWQLSASYAWSRLDGDFILDPTDPNNLVPTVAIGRGPASVSGQTGAPASTGQGTSNDQPHAFKVIGSYLAPLGFTVGANLQILSGLPRDRTLSVPLAQGSTTYRVEERGAYRADTMTLLSFKADKVFRLHEHARVSAFFELHNLLNSNAAQANFGSLTQAFASQAVFDARRTTTSYFGRVQEILAPRIAKVGVKFEF